MINACTPLNANVGTASANITVLTNDTDIDFGDALSITDAIADNGSVDTTIG